MAYKKKATLTTDVAIQLGGRDPKTNKPNPTKVEGYYLGFKEVDSDYGIGKLHIFQTQKGNVGVWGKTMLDGLLTSDLLGMMVLAEFTGMGKAKKGRKPPYQFSVSYDDENTIDVTGIAATADDAEDAVEDDGEETISHEEVYADDDSPEEDSAFDEEAAPDEVPPPARAKAPKKAAATLSADRQARVAALLAGTRK